MADTHVNVGGPGPWHTLVKKCFHGNKGILHGNPNVLVSAGVPSSFKATVGTLCWDKTNSHGYICTVADTTWVKINA